MTNEAKLKVAMPEALGLALVSYIAMMVGLVLLDVGFAPTSLGMIGAFLPYAGMLLAVVTVFSYLNDNMFATVLFGWLALFFWAFPYVMAGAPGVADLALYILFTAFFLLVMTFVSTAQPVKMVTGVLLLAGLTFLFVGIWAWTSYEAVYATIGGFFGVITGLLAMYVPAAILYNTMKGDNVLPLM